MNALEIDCAPDDVLRARARLVLGAAVKVVYAGEPHFVRAETIQTMGFTAADSLHLAIADRAEVEAFLTVDDRLLRRAAMVSGNLFVRVANPTEWLEEREQ